MCPYFYVFSRRIPTYGVMMIAGVLAAGMMGVVRVHRAALRWENAVVIIACSFGFALMGAMGLYLLVTYRWSEIVELVKTGELFTGNRLGLVFYGGIFGAIPGVLLGTRITGSRLEDYIPPMLPCVPLGHAFGRIGCLLAGCCYGIPTDLPIGIVYREAISDAPKGIALFPVQALESLILIGIFLILVRYTRQNPPAVRVVALYLMTYAICRFGLEWLRYDAIRGYFGDWSTSQWISIILFYGGLSLWFSPRRTTTRGGLKKGED